MSDFDFDSSKKRIDDIINSMRKDPEFNRRYMAIINVSDSNMSYSPTELHGACKSGNLNVVKMLIEHGENDWNSGLYGACEGGHSDIFQLMEEKGANDWNQASVIAHKNGHLNIIKLLIEKGIDDWNSGLYRACENGHLNVVESMIEHGANDFNTGLYKACQGGHLHIIKLMIEKGAFHWQHIIIYSFDLIDSEIVDLMIKKKISFEYYFEYPKDGIQIFKLLDLGLPIDNLKGINGFDNLIKGIEDRKNIVKNISFDNLIKDLAETVAGYVTN